MNKLTFHKKLLAVLIDPDKTPIKNIKSICQKIELLNADIILVGGSILFNSIDKHVEELKKYTQKSVYIFPGSIYQISTQADGILFLSLLSGRNPEYLIGQQVLAAPILKHTLLDVLPVAYILIDGGRISSVQYMSNTMPIPSDKTDIVLATCYAAEYLGFKAIYLEAGSGAEKPIPFSLVQTVSQSVSIPIIVGGGIRNKEMVLNYFEVGANMVVVGTAFENDTFEFNRE
ncbi:MAG: geranylgeranylglyceryl/heptaprenylglyceryl phosphate synthase [Bacteroidales bacterium]|nr:geranylgeranylglyceryl/heptaprenylglyceryl phosphate synthase [Bacteroidales bacterium]